MKVIRVAGAENVKPI